MLTKTPRRAALPASPDAADADSNEPQRKLSRRRSRLKGTRKLDRQIPRRPAAEAEAKPQLDFAERVSKEREEECEAQTNGLLAELGIEGPLSEEEWGEIARAVERWKREVERFCEPARPEGNSQDLPAPVSADQPIFFEFDYSKEEWSEIEKAARSARNRPLPKQIREDLVDFACEYLAMRTSTRSRRRQAWQKVVLQVDRLQQTILVAAGGMQEDWLSTLTDIRCGAEIAAVALSEEDPVYFKNNSKMEYEFMVLSIWTSLGGKLKISRNSRTGKIDGPLARFFRVVTVPVMGTLAPSLESLPDIVQRQKRVIASRKKTLPILQLLERSRMLCVRSEVLGRNRSARGPFWAFPLTWGKPR